MKSTTRALIAGVVTTLMLTLGACSAPPDPEPEAPTPEAAPFPRTIIIPAAQGIAEQTLTIENEPMKIATVGHETAETVAELGASSRLTLIPKSVLTPVLGNHQEQLSSVENTYATEMDVDAETIIQTAPDLVLLHPRHGAEERTLEVLQQAGIPVLMLPTAWATREGVTENIRLIGEAIGSEDEARTLIESLERGWADAQSVAETDEAAEAQKPRVLMMSNQAGRPFVVAGAAFGIEMLTLAGAEGEQLGMERTGPVQVEQVVAANPDGIVLVDMNGSSDQMFAELLANEAVQALEAVSQDRILRVEGKEVQALGLTSTVTGLERLGEWVRSLP